MCVCVWGGKFSLDVLVLSSQYPFPKSTGNKLIKISEKDK